MNVFTSGSVEPSQVDVAYAVCSVEALYALSSGLIALQSAAFHECPDTYARHHAQVSVGVQMLIEIRSDSPVYVELRGAALKLLENVLGVEDSFYRAVRFNLRRLPERAIGDEEADQASLTA